MIDWYNTVFLNRQSSHGEAPVVNTSTGKPKFKKLISGVIEQLNAHLKVRREQKKFKDGIRLLSKLSYEQLDDVGLVPADLINLRWNSNRTEALFGDVEGSCCEVRYLPNMAVQGSYEDCDTIGGHCLVKRAA